jgi:ORF6N domain
VTNGPMDDETPAAPESSSGAPASEAIAAHALTERIVIVRGRRVMVDVDLAVLYGVAPKRLNEQVRRNRARFPDDFVFQLALEEARVVLASRSHIATLKRGQNLKYAPQVFTEHGAVMLAAVLNSPIAIDASIQVVRAFVRLRAMVATHEELALKLNALERKFDHQFSVVFEAIHQLMMPASTPARIGFRAGRDGPAAEGNAEE